MLKGFVVGAAGVLLATMAGPATAQQRLFAESAPLTVTVQAPFGKIVRNAENSTAPLPGAFTIQGASGPSQPFPIQIGARGFTRRTGDFCSFPPLKLDFDGPTLQGTVLQGQNKLKLVTQCRPQPSYEQLLVLEYTAYRLYNAVTPLSFRVRPLQVTYNDTEGRRADAMQFAFVIEDADAMAKRNDRVELDLRPNQISSAALDPGMTALYGLFQLMIGNLDWEYVAGPPGDDCCHNTKIIAREGTTSGHVPVPYDFDFSGFVDASYATPPDIINVPNVRTRYYRGLCRVNAQLPAAVATLHEKRAAFAAVIAGEEMLSPGNKARTQRYLDDFFEMVDTPARFEREVVRRCR